MVDTEGSIPCTACGAAIYKDWTRAFKSGADGTMQPYHLRCAAPTDECPECERPLSPEDTKCWTCSGADYAG
jgi:hypothetical protein